MSSGSPSWGREWGWKLRCTIKASNWEWGDQKEIAWHFNNWPAWCGKFRAGDTDVQAADMEEGDQKEIGSQLLRGCSWPWTRKKQRATVVGQVEYKTVHHNRKSGARIRGEAS